MSVRRLPNTSGSSADDGWWRHGNIVNVLGVTAPRSRLFESLLWVLSTACIHEPSQPPQCLQSLAARWSSSWGATAHLESEAISTNCTANGPWSKCEMLDVKTTSSVLVVSVLLLYIFYCCETFNQLLMRFCCCNLRLVSSVIAEIVNCAWLLKLARYVSLESWARCCQTSLSGKSCTDPQPKSEHETNQTKTIKHVAQLFANYILTRCPSRSHRHGLQV